VPAWSSRVILQGIQPVSGLILSSLPTGLVIYGLATTLQEEGIWENMMMKKEEVLDYLWGLAIISGKNTRVFS